MGPQLIRFRRVGLFTLAAAVALTAPPSFAQVPPHQPGTLCFTPQFWCFANPPGPPNTACACATRFGPVNGVRG
jgi:hypothetical protein